MTDAPTVPVPIDVLIGLLRDRLPAMVVYDHPTDHPDAFVARLWLTLPKAEPTNMLLKSAELDPLRDSLRLLGFVQLMRNPEDDANIVETWV